MASEGYHEPIEVLPEDLIDRHRAIVSIMEELEAVDWYDQRVAATGNAELAAILAHNRDEEKEHAAMVIEWLRRNDGRFDEELRTYLFTDVPVTDVEDAAMGRAEAAGDTGHAGDAGRDTDDRSRGTDTSLAIGSLRTADEETQP